MESEKKIRITYIDIVKAIAMIGVVMVHACVNNKEIWLSTNAYLIRILSAFAMPVFFFVNGFLYKNKNIDHPVKEIVRKIKSYYFPFLAYNLFYLVFHNLFVYLHMLDAEYGNSYYGWKEYAKHFLLAITGHREFFSGALWFLGSILMVNIVYILVDYFIYKTGKTKYLLYIMGAVTFILVLAGNSGYVPSTMKLSTSCAYSIYFFLGMIYRRKDLNKYFLKHKIVFIVLGVAFNLLISYIRQYNPLYISNAIIFIILDYINSCFSIIAILLFAQCDMTQKSKVLNTIGKNTMDIMGFHFMVFKIVSLGIIAFYSLPIERLAEYPVLMGIGGGWWILYTIIGILIPTLFGIWRHTWNKKEDIKVMKNYV